MKKSKFRNTPPVCLLISISNIMMGSTRLIKKNVGKKVKIDKNREFTVFRQIINKKDADSSQTVVFTVSFKFARLSHKANKITSLIPMLMIAGHRGFITKLYGVNPETGYWQGMYEWRSNDDLEVYKKSLVFRIMNKRAVKNSIKMDQFENTTMNEFLNINQIK